MTEIVKATWRLPADLHRRIETLARRSRRSMNQQVVYLLESHPEVVAMPTNETPPPIAGGSQLAEQREAVLFIHAEDPADKMPRFRTVVRVYEDGTARAEEQLQYQYEHRGKVVTVWQTIDRPDGSDVLSPETVARYIKTAADLGVISRQAADEAVEQIRQDRPVPIDYTTSKGSHIDSSTTTVGDVEYALQHLGAKVGRRTPEGYIEDPNGDLIWWSGGDWPNPHCAVPLQRFLEAGGRLPA